MGQISRTERGGRSGSWDQPGDYVAAGGGRFGGHSFLNANPNVMSSVLVPATIKPSRVPPAHDNSEYADHFSLSDASIARNFAAFASTVFLLPVPLK